MAPQDLHLLDALEQVRGRQWLGNQICSVCESIIFARSTMLIPHRETARAIREEGYRGCHMCSLLHGSFPLVAREDCQPSSAVLHDGPWVAEIQFKTPHRMTIDCYTSELRNQSLILELEGSIEQSQSFVTTLNDNEVNFYDSTGSHRSLQTASSWIHKCFNEHSGVCESDRHELTHVVPTRLINIQESSTSLSLVENPNSDVRYLILSYCWGEERADELKLQKHNTHDFRQNIAFKDLPQTVADAVVVTLKLGYVYLWVDRLCIVQDDSNDWKREAARMGDYYLNADCCIADEWSDSAHKGLFKTRNPLIMQALQVEDVESNTTATITAKRIGNEQGHYPRMYRGPIYPLSRRAWVLQERLLSPRTIYFGSMMVYWECRKMVRTENRPHEDHDIPYSVNLRKFGSRSIASPQPGDRVDMIPERLTGIEDIWRVPVTESEKNTFEERWADLVEHYTACGMSYPHKDRLLAISGIMSTVTVNAREVFVYGLLESRLTTEILWWQWIDARGKDEVVPTRTGPQVNAPTWSWVSVTGRVQPFRSRRMLTVERRVPWKVEIKAKIDRDSGYVIPGGTFGTSLDGLCRIEFEAPIIETTVIARMDMRHYCWIAEAVGQIGQEHYLSFNVRLWPDESFQAGNATWLLRCATLDANESREFATFEGLLIAPLTDGWESGEEILHWRRTGYWQSTTQVHPVPTGVLSSEQKQAARRTALNSRFKLLYLS